MKQLFDYHASISMTPDLEKELGSLLSSYPPDKVFLVTEEHCDKYCFPLIQLARGAENLKKVIIPAGEENKNLSSVEKIWFFLSQNGADRKSLLINLGGGMLTDLGSFAASTFKRGMDFINIPTTLLSQVDASVGGKTGFNFNGLKNEIGVINQPKTVLIDPRFLKTLDQENFLSGYAEMIKHGLIQSKEHLKEIMAYEVKNPDPDKLMELISHSVAIKDEIVFQDPNERTIRKALNFGHTIGHAFESYSYSINKPVLHGFAVAYGMMAELYLSHLKCKMSERIMKEMTEWLQSIYGKFPIPADDFETLYGLMTHDKKNEGKKINFTLIPEPGEVFINQDCTKDQIMEALAYYSKL
jgi:3-dehydroquinate synthase